MRRNLRLCITSTSASIAATLLAGCGEPSMDLQDLASEKLTLAADLPTSFTPKTAAAVSGRFAGTAVTLGPLLREPIYAATLAAHFSDATPENETKWGSLQPSSATRWNFADADALVSRALASGLRVKGHTLAWHSQLPPFITEALDPGQINAAMVRHINETVPRYAGKMFAWDVVNEAIADDGGGLRDSLLSRKLGADFIPRAFQVAHARDLAAELYYNDYGIETINPKSDAVYELLAGMIADGIPVHGVGMQGHIDARFAPSVEELRANFDRFGDLGLTVTVSELDVRVARIPGNRSRKLAVQKQIYQRVAQACVESAACSGITTWGFTDAHSWIDSTFGADDPLLFDEQYQKKPAYFGYIDGLLGVPLDAPGLEPNLIGNSSFEAGLDGWDVLGSGSLSVARDAAHTGYRSAAVSGRSATWNGPRRDVSSLTRAGRSYDVSVWTRLAGGTSDAQLTAQVTCAGEATQFIGLGRAAASDAGWVQLAGVLELPACTLASVAVYVEGPAPGVTIQVDDLALRERPLDNLIGNPDFEAGTGGWFGWGATSVTTTTDALSGAQAALGRGRTDSWNGIATDLTSVVQAEGAYQATAFAKLAGASSGTLALTARLRCAGGSDSFVRVATAAGSDTGWTELSGGLVLPNCPLEAVTLYVEGPPAGVDILLDDVSLAPIESSEGPNVLANRDFEVDTSGWFPFGNVGIAATTARAHSGARSALVSGRTATFNGIATSLVGVASAGRTYRVRGFAQVSTPSAPVRFTLQSACSGGAASFTTVASATAADGTWIELDGAVTLPSCALTTANLYIEGPPAGTDIYLDDVSVREQL